MGSCCHQGEVEALAIHTLLGLQPCHWASQNWWKHSVQATWDDKQWLEAFCATQATFLDLVEQLCLHLECQNTTMRQALPMETWLAITMMKLAMPTSLHNMGHLFGVGKATTGQAVLEVSSTLQNVLGHIVLGMYKPVAFAK
ncbi:hypothetical protein Y1Q_0004131 [Alligator mississippiensis]|uniref:Uncharacterized protein n=1 Tax=Alligator mississippiensis TaxID=8496 RepID=A0A151PI16_ALLMI|nr:hypothetical protein Y1Q_0004131 [Alligator mississippiensis]